MSDRRSLLLSLIAVTLAVLGMLTTYVERELADPAGFADRSVDALTSREVRVVIAEQIAVDLLERRSPELVASRPVVLAAVEAVLDTESFARVLRKAALSAHEALLEGEEDALVELERAREVLLPSLRNAAPELAERFPADLSPQITEIRRTDAAAWVLRAAHGAQALTIPLLVAAAVALFGAVALASDRRRALIRTGMVCTAGAIGGLAALAVLREEALSHAGPAGVVAADDVKAAAAAVWDALVGDLSLWLVGLAAAGGLVSTAGLIADGRVDREAAARRLASVLAGARLPAAARVLRGAALVCLGALILIGTEPLRTAAIYGAGGVLALTGLAELISIIAGEPRNRAAAHLKCPPRRAWPAAAGIVGAVAIGYFALGAPGGKPALPAPDAITRCNGSADLCERPLDQVVFPGTHNSMSAADRPGWFFANQIRPIPRQLEEGIRFLMLDPHYGIVDANGRVRTDVEAEGTTRNRVGRQLGPEAVAAAESLATRLGLVPGEGERELFLCHTLCELGAQRMSAALDEIRGFLEANPLEVVVVFLESSVDTALVQEAFDSADLTNRLARLMRGEPLPTLRELVESGRQLVVFDQGDGGDAPWYQPAFVHIQDTTTPTSIGASRSCEPNRGTPDNPLLMMNHWVDGFPPDPEANAAIGRQSMIIRRAQACRRLLGRLPNLIAVDFYDRSGVVAAATQLNDPDRPDGG